MRKRLWLWVVLLALLAACGGGQADNKGTWDSGNWDNTTWQ